MPVVCRRVRGSTILFSSPALRLPWEPSGPNRVVLTLVQGRSRAGSVHLHPPDEGPAPSLPLPPETPTRSPSSKISVRPRVPYTDAILSCLSSQWVSPDRPRHLHGVPRLCAQSVVKEVGPDLDDRTEGDGTGV